MLAPPRVPLARPSPPHFRVLHSLTSSRLYLGLRAHRRRCVTNRPAAAETATSGMSIRRNDQLIRYSPLTTVASTPKATIRTTPIGTRKEGWSRPRIKPITKPLATGSSSSTITHHPLAVGSRRITSVTKPSAPRSLAGTSRTLLTSFPCRRAIFLVDALTYTQSSVVNADESAMNLDGLGLFSRHYLDFPQHLCELGGNFAENVASPSIATEEAASSRPYGLGLQGEATILA